MNPEEQQNEDMQRLEDAVNALREWFDTVQIFCTREIDEDGDMKGNTVECDSGAGNWHARQNQCREWVVANDERVRLQVRKTEG